MCAPEDACVRASTSIWYAISSRAHRSAAFGDQGILCGATGRKRVHAIGGLRALFGAIGCGAAGTNGHVRPTAAVASGRGWKTAG